MARGLFDHLRPQAATRGLFGPRPRPRMVLIAVFSIVCVFLLTSHSSSSSYQAVPWKDPPTSPDGSTEEVPEEELSEAQRKERYEKHEQELRDTFAAEYERAKT